MKYRNFVLSIAFVGLITSMPASADDDKTICGSKDDREPSSITPIARLVKTPGGFGCTGTLISPTCMISAGHCGSFFKYAEFNVPPSTEGGRPVASAEEDRYPVVEVVGRANSGDGNDWAVIRLGPNPVTGILPGDRQGFFEIMYDRPQEGTFLRITGYGTDKRRPTRTGTQQTATGQLTGIRESSAVISYSVDTEPGNSGSSIIDEVTGKIIGVHTTGYCSSSGGANVGTAIVYRAEFRRAIMECLRRSMTYRNW